MPTSKKSKPAPAKPSKQAAKPSSSKKPAAQGKTVSKPAPAKKPQPKSAAKPPAKAAAKPSPVKPKPAAKAGKAAPAKPVAKPAAKGAPAKPSAKPVAKLEKRPEKPVKQAPPAKAPSAKPAPAVKGSASKKSPPTPAGKGSATAKTPPAPAPVAPAKAAATAKQTAPASKASIPPAKASAAKQAADAASDKPAAAKAQTKADALRARILERRSTKPIAFSLDEVREIAKTVAANSEAKNGAGTKTGHGKQRAADEIESKIKKVAQPHFVKAASLADILGYNPEKQSSPTTLDEDQIDPKFQRYYKLLVELREHVATGLDTHTEQTLKRSAKDDAGDLSSYAQHMADAGTDTFDRDFALSLVSSEQEALAEI
jgi:hypothetical protein